MLFGDKAFLPSSDVLRKLLPVVHPRSHHISEVAFLPEHLDHFADVRAHSEACLRPEALGSFSLPPDSARRDSFQRELLHSTHKRTHQHRRQVHRV